MPLSKDGKAAPRIREPGNLPSTLPARPPEKRRRRRGVRTPSRNAHTRNCPGVFVSWERSGLLCGDHG